MNQKYSNKTLDAMAHFIESYFSHTEMDSLFFACSVPKEFDSGSSKLQRALNVLRNLAEAITPESKQYVDDVFKEAILRTASIFDKEAGPSWRQSQNLSNVAESLKRTLRADGFTIHDKTIIPLDSLEKELAEETTILDRRLHSFLMEDVRNNLDQAHENFVSGNFESCNAMLRTALESTIEHVAKYMGGSLDRIPHRNPKYHSPVDFRKFLKKVDFFKEDEYEYVNKLYAYASKDGSHPGISNEAESRLRRLMIVALIQYCMEKLEFQHQNKE